MSLIQMQDAAIRQMQEPRTSVKRAAKHRNAVIRQYRAAATKLGYSAEQVDAQIRDVRDMFNLQQECE